MNGQKNEWLSDDFPGSRFLEIIEKDNKVYGIISNGAQFFFDSTSFFQLSLYEIQLENQEESDLKLHEINRINYSENYATIAVDFVESIKRWLVVQSSVISQGFQRYRVLLYNEDFDIVDEKTIDTLGYPIPFHINSHDGKTYILGSLLAPPRDEILYLIFDHSHPDVLPAIKIRQSEPKPMFFITSMNIDASSGNMLTFYYNGIAVLDSNLYQVKKFDHTSHINTSDHGTLLRVGDNYYSHGAKRQPLSGLRWLLFQNYDTAFNIITADTFGITGKDNYPFVTSSLDYRNGEMLVGGHFGGPLTHLNFAESIKEFYVAKYDTLMNQIWVKKFGGDRAYVIYGLKLLEDQSSLIYGSVTDTNTFIRYAYIMHLDENGEFITSTNIPPPITSIKLVNPGSEILYLRNPDGLEGQIILFDLDGNVVLRYDLSGGLNEISTEGLPAALYPYVIMSDGQYLASGKWVKSN